MWIKVFSKCESINCFFYLKSKEYLCKSYIYKFSSNELHERVLLKNKNSMDIKTMLGCEPQVHDVFVG